MNRIKMKCDAGASSASRAFCTKKASGAEINPKQKNGTKDKHTRTANEQKKLVR
jgi:hypothetical protein